MTDDTLRMIPVLKCQARAIHYTCHYRDGRLQEIVRLEQESTSKQRFIFNVKGSLVTVGQNQSKVYTRSEQIFSGMPLMLYTVGDSFISERPHRKNRKSYRLDRRDGSMSGLTFYREGKLVYHLVLELYYDQQRQLCRQLFKYAFLLSRSSYTEVQLPSIKKVDCRYFKNCISKKQLKWD